MSLQVWLPLDGNLKNQGLTTNISVVNNGATINTNGKIGKCYCFENDSSYITISKEAMNNFSDKASVCFWLKILSWNKEWATFFQAGTNGTGWENYIFGFSRDGKTDKCCFTISHGSTSNGNNYKTPSLLQNEWYHIALTYRTGNCLMYINGELYQPYSTSIVPNFSGIINIVLGKCTDGTNYQTNCLINDFRIYNHCLSEQEIKKISQGLILHYPFNNRGFGKENLLQYDTSFYTFSLGTTTYFTNQMNNNSVCEIVNNSKRGKCLHLYSHHTGDLNFSRVYKTFSGKANKKYIFSYDFMSTSTQEESGRIEIHGGDYTSYLQVYGEQYLEVNKWKRMKVQTPVLTSDTTIYMFFYCKPETHCYFKNIKLQISDISTSWIPNSSDSQYTALGLNNTRIADISGFGNNGTMGVTGDNLKFSENTIIYKMSGLFDGINNSINIGNFYNVFNNSDITINIWWMKTQIGTKNYQTLFGGPSGFEMDTRAAGSSDLVLYMTGNGRGGNVLGQVFNFNTWYMFTMVRNSSNEIYYVNGEYAYTIQRKDMPNGNYFIGSWRDATSQNFQGNISDFRIYCTALSASDIKELYENRR